MEHDWSDTDDEDEFFEDGEFEEDAENFGYHTEEEYGVPHEVEDWFESYLEDSENIEQLSDSVKLLRDKKTAGGRGVPKLEHVTSNFDFLDEVSESPSHIPASSESQRKLAMELLSSEETPLFLAAAMGNLAEIESQIADGVDVNTQTNDGLTAVLIAAACGQREAVSLLLDSNAALPDIHGHVDMLSDNYLVYSNTADLLLNLKSDLEKKAMNGKTPLHEAAVKNDIPACKLLLLAGAGVDTLYEVDNQTALMLAAAKGHADIVRMLITAGADVNKRTTGGRTALIYALCAKNPAGASLLLAAGANVNVKSQFGEIPLLMASKAGRSDLMEMLLKAKANLEWCDAETNAAGLLEAATRGYTDVAALLLQANASPIVSVGRNGHNLLRAAIVAQKPRLIRLFVDAGAQLANTDLDVHDVLAVAATSSAQADLVRAIVAAKADVNGYRTGRTHLARAAKDGPLEVVQVLLEAHADVTAKDVLYDSTPLLNAACEGRIDVLIALLAAGAPVNVQCRYGLTPLMLAARCGCAGSVRLLIDSGERVDLQDEHGRTAMSYVAAWGHVDAMDELLESKASIEARDNHGNTPLMLAALASLDDVVVALLDRKADITASNKQGQTALMYAVARDFMSTMSLLLDQSRWSL